MEFPDLRASADAVARDFLKSVYHNPAELDITIARNVILDCMHASPEHDFIAKACRDRILASDARRVVRRMEPHLVELAGRAYTGAS